MSSEKLRVAFGSVVNVRAIPTRGVTRVEIELPIEFHAELTRLLFGRDALVLPSNLPPTVNYGVMDSAGTDSPVPDHGAEAARPAPTGRSGNEASGSAFGRLAGRSPGGTVTRGAPTLDIIKWLGMRCDEASFQGFLQTTSSEGAAQAVRDICGVASRSQIPADTNARALFYKHIYHPYQRHLAQEAGRRHGFEP